MTKEKTNLIKTLKDENLRAETHKYTQNLLNSNKQRSLTVPNNTIKNKIENNDTKEKNNEIIINDDKILNTKEKKENVEKKKKKKVKKKFKLKKTEKTEKIEKIENGQKYKLLTYKTLNEINKEKDEKKNNNDDTKIKKNENIDISKKEESEKNINTNDKENEKSNSSRRDLLNSLNNLKYNFDNLMEIGVHGNKYLNNKKK